MIKHVLYFAVMAAAMLGLSHLLKGFEMSGWQAALIAALVLALMNTVVRPILFVLTLPFTILTLGLFLFVLNAIVLWLTSLLVPGFHIRGILTALVASLALAMVSMLWKAATRKHA
ncbi:MAG: phage holin family protein [Candidatus Eisenbacteria bacterium]|nr:phage holin family protein [Candidatus Eisenbacteria bacterium]